MKILLPKDNETVHLNPDDYILSIQFNRTFWNELLEFLRTGFSNIEVNLSMLRGGASASSTPTLERNFKRFLESEIKQLLQDKINRNPVPLFTDNSQLDIDLKPCINANLASLSAKNRFEVSLIHNQFTHKFYMEINLANSAGESPFSLSPSNPGGVIVSKADEEQEFMVLYENTVNTLNFLLKFDSDIYLNRWLGSTNNLLNNPEISVTNLSISNDIDDADLVEKIIGNRDKLKVEVKKSRKPNTYRMNITLEPQKVLKENERELIMDFTVKLRSNIDRGVQPSFTIPLMLKAKSYGKIVALDFGTTQTASIYFEYNQDPTQDPRLLTVSQNDNLPQVVVWLIEQLEKLGLKPLEESLIRAGRSKLYSRHLEDQTIKSLADIRLFLTDNGLSPKELSPMITDFILHWHTNSWAVLNIENPGLLEPLNDLYFQCIDRMVEINIQQDHSIILPELEQGGDGGQISSAVRMDKLHENKHKILFKDAEIDPFESQIKMGLPIIQQMTSGTEPEENKTSIYINSDAGIIEHRHYLTGIKRMVGRKEKAIFTDLSGGSITDTYDPLAYLAIRFVLGQVEKRIGGGIDEITVTYPANLPQIRRARLKSLVKSCGIRNVDTNFDEATAGVLYYAWQELMSDQFSAFDGFLSRSQVQTVNDFNREHCFQNFLIFDMGGGTTDIALLEIKIDEKNSNNRKPLDGRDFEVTPRLLGLTGLENFGGDNVTLAVFRILKSKLAELVARSNSVDSTVSEKMLSWIKSKERAQDPYNKEEVKESINKFIPTYFKDNDGRHRFFTLWQEAERIKINLSKPLEDGTYPKSIVANTTLLRELIPAEFSKPEDFSIIITGEEMESLILHKVVDAFDKARNICKNELKEVIQIDKVILAGNSSQLPIIRKMVKRELYEVNMEKPIFRYAPDRIIFNARDAKLAVARGAVLPKFLEDINFVGSQTDKKIQLEDGKNLLKFNVNELRNEIPYTITYAIGALQRAIAFLIGEKLKDRRAGSDSLPSLRKLIPAGDISKLVCYRVDGREKSEVFYRGFFMGIFKLKEAIGMREDVDPDGYNVILEFNSDRNLRCFIFEKEDNWSLPLKPIPEMVERVKNLLVRKNKESDVLEWCSYENYKIICDSPTIGRSEEDTDELLADKLNPVSPRARKYNIRVSDREADLQESNSLAWSFEWDQNEIHDLDIASVDIKFVIGDAGIPELSYRINNPDPDTLMEVSLSWDESSNSIPPFNPFNGNE